MITIDIVCLIILGIFLLQGLWYGFLKGLFYIIAWGAAVLGAYFSYDFLGSFFTETFNWSNDVTHICCLALGFLIPFIGFSILGKFLHEVISKSFLSLPNRLLGALIGVLKAVIILSFILTIVHLLPLSGEWEKARANAVSYNLYIKELEFLGIETFKNDIAGFVKNKTNEASEKIKESTEKVLNDAVESAKQSAVESVKNVLSDSLSSIANAKLKQRKDSMNPAQRDSANSLSKNSENP